MADSGKWLKDNWMERMRYVLSLQYPNATKEQIDRFVQKKFDECYTDHNTEIYNSYENISFHTTLGETVDWFQSFKPLMAESGVYFYPKNMKRNVNTEIIKECMLDARTIHKKEKFEALAIGDEFTARVKDKQQLNDKTAANSGYGAEGQSSSFLFNMHSAMSVTASGRGQLSTATLTIENFLADYVKFWSMDEFYNHIYNITSEKHEWKYSVSKMIDIIPSREQWVKRFKRKFLHQSLYDEESIYRVYDSLSDEMRIRLYYKCNMTEFFLNKYPRYLLSDLMCTPIEFKKEHDVRAFIDPNDVPDSWKDKLGILTEVVLEYVGYRYSQFRYEDKTRYMKRAVVPVSDTDSIFIALHNMSTFFETKVLPLRLYKKGDIRKKHYHLAVIGVLSCMCTSMINQTLHNYLDVVHVAPEDQKYIKMKNEFHYSRLIITYAKKSYVGLLIRQESHVFDEPKIDVKGINFFKSTASKRTSDFIYDEILMKELLQPKDGTISLQSVYRKIYEFQEQIATDIKNGDMGFLKRSIKVKSPDAYSDPMRVSAYKAAWVWNYLAEDTDQIIFPAITTQVKVVLRTKQDAAKLEPWPEIYHKIIELFDTNPEIGDHYEEVKNSDGSHKQKLVKGKGINAIALPDTYEYIPDWLLAIIDVEKLVNNNMQLFTQLCKPLGLSLGETSHNGESLKYYTNIVRL